MNPSAPTEHDLVRGLHDRDHAAFARVYAMHSQGVYNLCARILGDREEARDVTQEVFLKAFSRPPAAAEDVKLRAWLFRVATNTCLNLRRSRRRGSGPAEMDALPAAGDAYEQALAASLIERSLGEMNARYRAALVLKDLQGLDTAELAGVMEVSRPAADVLVHRSRAAFRRIYAELAGEGAVVPASLALVLVPLQLPASLATVPPFAGAGLPPALPGPAGPSAPGPSAPSWPSSPSSPGPSGLSWQSAPGPMLSSPGPGLGSAAGPAGAGLLAKLGAALTTKAAIVAAGATLVVGGGVAVHESRHSGAGATAAAAGDHAGTAHAAGAHRGEHASHDLRDAHHMLVAAHAAAHDSSSHDLGSHHSSASASHEVSHAQGDGGSSATQAAPSRHTGASVQSAGTAADDGGMAPASGDGHHSTSGNEPTGHDGDH